VIKPKPFDSLKNFTVPFAITLLILMQQDTFYFPNK
jgi:hypothetical protein